MRDSLRPEASQGDRAPQLSSPNAEAKNPIIVSASDVGKRVQVDGGSAGQDGADMFRMGRKQQLVRRFDFLSILSFIIVALGSWEIAILVFKQGLVDGGRAGLVWSFVWSVAGFVPVYLSLAEMASMAPIAGSQYHWVSEFAPEKYQKILSYITGWTSAVALQAGNAQGTVGAGLFVQSLILINHPDYALPSWQGTLYSIAAILIAYLGNVWLARLTATAYRVLALLVVLGYLAYIIPIWVRAPRASAAQVFTEFENSGGWSSMALAVFVGQLSPIIMLLGQDNVAHMSEEVTDASRWVPLAMLSVFGFNVVILFVIILTVTFAMPDLDLARADATGYPTLYVLQQAMPTAGVDAVLAFFLLLLSLTNINWLSMTSRDLFAFARDSGVPFSGWLSKVDPKLHIPLNAIRLSCVFATLLSLIYIGSGVAFFAITSLAGVAFLQCYIFSIGCVLWRRIALPHTLPPRRFSLGRAGVPINAAALLWAAWCFFWLFWPMGTPVTAEEFNWASVIFVGVLVIAGGWYVFRARKVYVGPVAIVIGRRAKAEELF